jgi:hypothetical protein
MATYLVNGQDDITITPVGDPGDETLTVTLDPAATHVLLKNLDRQQGVMYTLGPYPVVPPAPPPQKPVFPDDWSKLDPRKEVEFPIGSFTVLHLRKLKFIRGTNATHDVAVKVQIGQTAEAV